MSAVSIGPAEFEAFRGLIRDLTGISLDSSKVYLVEARLSSLVKESGCSSFGELLAKVRSDAGGDLPRQVINRITTQETSFFRDTAPFEMLKFKIIPDLIDARRRPNYPQARLPIRIWSAACSTGQEVYSILIALHEALGDFGNYDIRVLGTDISEQAIAKASYGTYTEMELERGMPETKLARYFSKSDKLWKIRDEIRALASFRQFNLFENLAQLGRWDIVFCRNVAIYFSDEDKRSLFSRIASVMEADGGLIIGSTESLLGVCPQFAARRYLRSVFYQRAVSGNQ